MSKAVGISGAQGGGKSSLLEELARRGLDVDSFKVSRAVQVALGWKSLQEVMSSAATMMKFQREVLEQKYANDLKLKSCAAPIVLTERTFADVWSYTSHWTWAFVDRGDLTFDDALKFITEYTRLCTAAQNEVYDAVILLPLMPHVPWVQDPHRASQQSAGTIYENIEVFVERKMPITTPRHTIRNLSVQERADEVQHFLNQDLVRSK